MKIYRVEHIKTGKGPYHRDDDDNISATEREIILKLHNKHSKNRKTHPGPGSDGIYGFTSGHLFGCPTLPILHKWFWGFWNYFKRMNFQIVEYTVPDDTVIIGVSGLQVAFKKLLAIDKKIIK